jgi:hypothetical protein
MEGVWERRLKERERGVAEKKNRSYQLLEIIRIGRRAKKHK